MRIGVTPMPADFMSMSRNEMPSCFFFGFGSVRTRQNIQSAPWAPEVQIFVPLTTYASPSRTARVARLARSDPAPGSE